MQVIRKLISELVFDPNNARKHSQKNIDAIKGSLAKFGQQKPIVINEKNIIIAGNGTAQAARELGWDRLDCVVSTLKGYEETAFALADNRTAELAEWDKEVLGSSLHSLREIDFDLNGIGFDTLYLDGLLDIVNFEPGGLDDQGKLDEKKKALCPECGHEFTP